MKKKQIMIVTAAMAAALATGALPTTSAFASETKAPIQQQESQMGIQPFSQSNLETAVKAALYGPEVKKIKVFEHEFNVKPIEVVDLGGGKKYVKGQISHHLSFRPDDQLYYDFTVKDGEV
ncbi:methyltransferase, partial [Bacillus cereus]